MEEGLVMHLCPFDAKEEGLVWYLRPLATETGGFVIKMDKY